MALGAKGERVRAKSMELRAKGREPEVGDQRSEVSGSRRSPVIFCYPKPKTQNPIPRTLKTKKGERI
jgi:hypothetical protein